MLFFFFEFVLVFFDIELMKCVTKVKYSNITNTLTLSKTNIMNLYNQSGVNVFDTEDPSFEHKCSNFSLFNIHS